MNQNEYEMIIIIMGAGLIIISAIIGICTTVYSVIKRNMIQRMLVDRYGKPQEYNNRK